MPWYANKIRGGGWKILKHPYQETKKPLKCFNKEFKNY